MIAAVRDGLARRRWAVAAVLAGALGLLTRTASPDLADFAGAGRELLHGHLGAVYAGAWNQAGPAQLLASSLLSIGGDPDGTVAAPVVALVDAALVVLAMWSCRGQALRRELFAGLLALLWIAAPLPWNGHPAEVAVPVLWAYAIKLERGKRDLAAAGCLALSVAIAPWALLGVPCLLAGATLGRALRTGTLAVTLSVAGYLPFALTGHFTMFDLVWRTSGGTLAQLAGISEVTWWLRLAQGIVVAGGVAAFAWWRRADPLAVAVVPLAAALLRVGTDPVMHPYYWYPVAIASLMLFALSPRPLPAGVLGYVALLAESANLTVAGPLICLGLLGLIHWDAPPVAFRAVASRSWRASA